MSLIPARSAERRQAFVALCLAADKRGLAVELDAADGALTAVRVVRPGAGRTAVKLIEAQIARTGVDAAAADCLTILTRERRA